MAGKGAPGGERREAQATMLSRRAQSETEEAAAIWFANVKALRGIILVVGAYVAGSGLRRWRHATILVQPCLVIGSARIIKSENLQMKTLEVTLPDRLAKQVKQLVEQGWFLDEAEVARQALSEFLSQHRFELQEQFQREDIRWALGLKEGGA